MKILRICIASMALGRVYASVILCLTLAAFDYSQPRSVRNEVISECYCKMRKGVLALCVIAAAAAEPAAAARKKPAAAPAKQTSPATAPKPADKPKEAPKKRWGKKEEEPPKPWYESIPQYGK